MTGERFSSAVSRRSVLAAAAAATGGCVDRVESVLGRSSPSQLSLSVKTLPADADARATRIARYFALRLNQVGIDARVVPLSREKLWRDVLLNHEFDLYVGRHPGGRDPDFLRPFLHSNFSTEPGWQNPFGYANLAVDDQLIAQRRQSGERRRRTVRNLQRSVARDQPFSVIAFPDEFRAARSDRFVGWNGVAIHTPLGYLSLRRVDAGDSASHAGTTTPTSMDGTETSLRMTLSDMRPTRNLNPLAVEFRDEGVFTGLLYDSLARRIDGRPVPWLAESWSWDRSETPTPQTAAASPSPNATTLARTTPPGAGDGPICDLTLREDLLWHDGEALTAEDVAFTYGFLRDTSLGSLTTPVPAPRFRGLTSLVDDVEVRSERRLRVRFTTANPAVAGRALTVPILPEHVWSDRTEQATVAGIETGSPVTEALVRPNMNPVGSGPLRFEGATVDESLTLVSFDDHFLERDTDGVPSRYAGGPAFDRLRFLVAPSSAAAVELLQGGEADATASGIRADDIPAVGRSDAVSLYAARSRSFYHVGYNLRRAPLASPRFRRAVASLLDEAFLVDDVFDGYARPAATPLSGTSWVAPALRWQDGDPELPFPGEDGQLDVEQARQAFVEAGYRYTDDGRLVTG